DGDAPLRAACAHDQRLSPVWPAHGLEEQLGGLVDVGGAAGLDVEHPEPGASAWNAGRGDRVSRLMAGTRRSMRRRHAVRAISHNASSSSSLKARMLCPAPGTRAGI